MRHLKAGASVAYRLAEFRPLSDVKVIGAMIGLLTLENKRHANDGSVELYAAITYNQARPSKARWWAQLKRDFLFYSQRDIYSEPTAPDDLSRYTWLPAGCYFAATPDKPLYIVIGATNSLNWDTIYDAFGCIYYQ